MSNLYRERLQDIIEYTSIEDKQTRPMLRAKQKETNKKTTDKNNNDETKKKQDKEDTTKEKSLADEIIDLVSLDSGNTNLNAEEYSKKLSTKMTKEMSFDYQNTRIFGMPHQFLKTADCRIDEYKAFGYCFSKDIFLERPVVTMVPGTTNFLPDMSANDKKSFASLMGDVTNDNKEVLKSILASFDADGGQRYYDFKSDYPSYIRYVNLMCRTCAVYLGIGNLKAPNSETPYKYYDWGNYMPYENYTVPEKLKDDSQAFSLKDTLSALYQKLTRLTSDVFVGYRQYTHFYVDPSTSVSESISNSAQKSQLEGIFDTTEATIKEANMILNYLYQMQHHMYKIF